MGDNGWKLQECRFVYRPTSMAEHSGIKSFLCDTIDKASIRAEWQKWVRAFQLYLDSENINESVRKRNKLLHLGGIELQEVAYNILGAIVEYNEANDNDVFGILVEALTKNIKPSNGESLNKFLLRLRQQATKCSFGNNADEATEINIKDKIIDDWAPLELKRKLLEKKRSLSDIIDLCQIHEQILDQSKVMGSCSTDIPSTSVNKISARDQNSQNCFRCGGNSHVGSSAQCPARNAKCHKCELMGHFANKCKTKPRKIPNKGNYNSAKRGRMTSSRVNYLDPVTSDEEDRHRGDKIRNYECFKIDNGRHSNNPNKEDELIECKVGGIPLTLLIDSGSKANIINGRDWEVLTKRQAVVWNIDSQSKNILKPYAAQQSLDIRHQFQTTVGTSDRREIITSFFVVDEGELSILGKDSAKRLGVLKLGLGVNCIQDVSVFPKVKNVKVSLTIDKTVKPVQQPLRRCKNCINYLDDIIVYGSTEQEHDDCLVKVMQVFEDILLNKTKCIKKVQQLCFLGHNLSHKGIDADQEKVKTILQFRPPTSKEEVRSFLGLVTYLGKFIPDLATTTEPLRQLTRRDAKFNWSEEHNNHFEKLKQVLTKPPTLSYFDPKKRTRLIADASPVALGAVLIQFECVTPKVVSFASKGLSDTERRYSQTEKESLALVWAVERFCFYLTGLEFELVTDHKPLEAIFKPTSRPPARIERWVLRLQAFKFKVIYQRGKSNIADSISRLCRINDTCTADRGSDLHIFAIVERGTPEAMSISEITAGSLRDPELLYAIRKMDDNSWETYDKNVYYPFRLELTNLGPILLRNNRIVIPVSQRQQILTLAHEGHPGKTVMKRRLRAKVWWPLIDRQVEQFVKHSRDCLLVSRPENHPPMARHSFPKGPWECLAIDLMGPLPNQEQVLVVIDYYSRYQSIKFLRTTTSSVIIRHLEELFCQLGIPKSIRADNGRQFSSQEFQDFCTSNNIQFIHTPPYWPQANGEVENMNKSILKRLQICQNNNRNYKGEIQKFIMMHNVTPHGTTGKSPSELILTDKTRQNSISTDIVGEEGDPEAQDNDIINKFKGKRREDGARRAKENDITVGDRVVVQHALIPHKLTSRFGTTEYVVTERRGNEVTVTGDGKTMKRHVTHVKRIPSITGTCVGTAESELAGSSTTKDGSEHQEASNDNHSSKGEAIRVEPLKLKRRDGMWEPVTTSHE
ncbi:hypothetical protein JTB14_020895 [Gonioctena quinquepunctata]|nr:hypothetical protein JTB14_020895 [Gonioctena quinquepunctata]